MGDTDVLRPTIGVTNQAAIALGFPVIEVLSQRVENKVRAHRVAHAPAYDAPRVCVDQEGYCAAPGFVALRSRVWGIAS